MRIFLAPIGVLTIIALAPVHAQTPAAPKAAAPAATPAKPAAAPAKPATPAASANPIVLTVGTEKITKSEFEQILESVTAQMPAERRSAAQSADGRRQMAEQLAELKALAQESRREKMDQTPDYKAQMQMRADQLAAGMLYQKLAKEATPDAAAIKAYYDEHKNEYDSVEARHILIRFKGSAVPLKEGQKDLTEEEALAKANDLRAKIVAGGDFAELAKTESDDAGSGANGGVLGEFTRGRMVPQFEEAAFKLKVNEVSEPVKTQFGYHVIQVTKHEAKSQASMQEEIEKKLAPEATQKSIDAIKAKTAITYDEKYFGK